MVASSDRERLLRSRIYHGDINSQADDIEAVWKGQYQIWERLTFQGAPPELVTVAAEVVTLLSQAHAKMKASCGWFPPEPQAPD